MKIISPPNLYLSLVKNWLNEQLGFQDPVACCLQIGDNDSISQHNRPCTFRNTIDVRTFALREYSDNSFIAWQRQYDIQCLN